MFGGRLVAVAAAVGLALLASVQAGFFRDEIYEKFDDVTHCYRRLNATHVTGCTSKTNGNVGVVYFLFAQTGFDEFEALAAQGSPPYTLVLPLHIFTRETAVRLRHLNAKKLVNGVVFYRGQFNITAFSTADTIPNRFIGYYAEKNESELPVWNPDGTNLQNERFDFPIFHVETDDGLKRLERCFNDLNRPYHFKEHKLHPMCSVRLKSFMFARDNSRRCYARSHTSDINSFNYCDPLESLNLFTVVDRVLAAPPHQQADPKQLVLLAARLDSTSLFSESAPGAVTVVTNLVTLLSVVHTIRTYLQANVDAHTKRGLMVALFGGEAYDFMGSQRFVYDLKANRLLGTFDLMLELNQLTNSERLFLHAGNALLNNSETAREFRTNFERNLPANYTLRTLDDHVIPPSSVQSFLVENASFPGLILSSFGAKFTNRFYNSELDTGRNSFTYTYKGNVSGDAHAVYARHDIQAIVGRVSETVAKSLLGSIVDGRVRNVPEPDLRLIDELLFCYLENLNCTVNRRLNLTIGDRKPSFYLGVAHSQTPIPILVKFTLAWLSGVRVQNVSTKDECTRNNTKDPEYFWFPETLRSNRNACFYAKIDANSSKSPAFLIDNYDWNSRMYSTWTESTWDDVNMEIFVQPSINADFVAIALGFCTLCASIIATYTLRLKSDILFANDD